MEVTKYKLPSSDKGRASSTKQGKLRKLYQFVAVSGHEFGNFDPKMVTTWNFASKKVENLEPN